MMDINIIKGNSENKKMVAQRALTHRLFVTGWHMRTDLHRIKNTGEGEISLAVLDGTPIGVAICSPEGLVQVFVRKKYRRKSVGRRMLATLQKNKSNHVLPGIKGSEVFYTKCWSDIGTNHEHSSQ